MRVLAIGTTGVLGRPAVRQLLADGHDVTGLARNAERAAVIERQGITPVVADLFTPDSLVNALHNQEAVLNLATRIPPLMKGLLGRGWAENNRIREQGSASLVEAALADGGVRIIVQEGIAFFYADGGDRELTETSPIEVPQALESAITAQHNVEQFAGAGGGRVGVALRIGRLHGTDPMTKSLLKSARYGVPLVYGDPEGWVTAIHPADAARGAVAALSAESGVYNVGATPVRKRELGAVMAQAAGAKKARGVPKSWLKGSAAIFGASQRVVSTKLMEATGWAPKMPEPSTDWFKE